MNLLLFGMKLFICRCDELYRNKNWGFCLIGMGVFTRRHLWFSRTDTESCLEGGESANLKNLNKLNTEISF